MPNQADQLEDDERLKISIVLSAGVIPGVPTAEMIDSEVKSERDRLVVPRRLNPDEMYVTGRGDSNGDRRNRQCCNQ